MGAEHSVFDLVERVRQAGLELISVSPSEPNLEEVFIELVERSERAARAGRRQGATGGQGARYRRDPGVRQWYWRERF